MPRPVLHNCYLPNWMHRLGNGAIGGLLALGLAIATVRLFGFPLWVLWFAIPAAIGCVAVNPRRLTLVEGCAGETGYDELDSEP